MFQDTDLLTVNVNSIEKYTNTLMAMLFTLEERLTGIKLYILSFTNIIFYLFYNTSNYKGTIVEGNTLSDLTPLDPERVEILKR